MPQQCTPHSQSLRVSVDPESRKTEYRQWVGRKTTPQSNRRHASTRQTGCGYGCKTENASVRRRDIRYCQMQSELVLPCVVLEEAIEVCLSARKRTSVVVRTQGSYLKCRGHAPVSAIPR
jgi:hypothetical protein